MTLLLAACLGTALFLLWLSLCFHNPFNALCAVLVIGMGQGLIKQAFNWSTAVYLILDLPWVSFLGVCLIRYAVKPRTPAFGVIDAFLLLFCLWSAVEILNPNLDSPYMAIGALRNRLLPLAFFWVGRDLLTAARLQRMLLVCLTIAGLGGLFGILEWLLGYAHVAAWGPGFVPRTSLAWRDDAGASYLRPLSIYQDAGLAALFSAVMAGVALPMWQTYHGWARYLTAFSGLACLIFVAVSGVRAAVCCAFVAVAFSLWFYWKRALPLAALVGGILILLLPFGAAKLVQRYQTLADPVGAYRQNRGQIADGAIIMAQNTPFGIGTGSATTSASTYVDLFDPGRKVTQYVTDNAYAVLVAEGGGILTFLYIGALALIGKQAWQDYRRKGAERDLAFVVALVTLLFFVWSATSIPIDWQPTNLLFWLLAGGLVSIRQRKAHSVIRGERDLALSISV